MESATCLSSCSVVLRYLVSGAGVIHGEFPLRRKMSYIASYIFLINYLAQKDLFPKVKLYKDTDVEIKDVDMVVDIGNSRTTALLIEDNTNFNQVRQLELIDYTNLVKNPSSL